jgi:hypothetical protein
MYLRWIVNPRPANEARKKIAEIITRNKSARNNVIHLRRKLQALEAEAEKLGILIDVKPVLLPDPQIDEI